MFILRSSLADTISRRGEETSARAQTYNASLRNKECHLYARQRHRQARHTILSQVRMGTGLRRLASSVVFEQAVGRKIRSVYVPGRDFIIYVGTTNPANTPEAGHRSRLLSLASIDHRTEYKTWELVPPESWEYAQREYANRWLYSFAITSAWNFSTLPFAPHIVPHGYRELGSHRILGALLNSTRSNGQRS